MIYVHALKSRESFSDEQVENCEDSLFNRDKKDLEVVMVYKDEISATFDSLIKEIAKSGKYGSNLMYSEKQQADFAEDVVYC